MATYYVLKVEKDAVLARVDVNDIPIGIWNRLTHVSRTDQLNAWVFAGRNELRVRLDPPQGEQTAPGATMKLTIEPVTKDQRGPARPLLEFSWPPANPEELTYPYEKLFHWQVEDAPPNEFWPNAQPIRLDDAGRGEVRRVLGELHAALANRDREAAFKMLEWKSIDAHKAHYMAPAEARSDLREYLDFFLSEKSWDIAPLDMETLELHVLAKDRLVWATQPDFVNPIRTREGAKPGIEIPVYFAPIDRQWRIVR
jgi:hypothetical protein